MPKTVWKTLPVNTLRAFRQSENLGLVLLALTIGVAGGIGAIFFRYLIDYTDELFFSGGKSALSFMGDAYVVVLPVIGLVLVSMLVRRFAPEAQGHGVPEVMYAVKKQGGRIRPRVAIVKALASALCIGSGGSVGREGPIVQIGCTIGSTLGQLLGLREHRVRLLVACGAAAAVGGTFNAPIAGVIFALEVILGNFAARSFGLVVISSVTATALCQAVLGNEPAFQLMQVFSLQSYLELPIYLVLGLVAGCVALFYTQTLYFLEGVFERWKWHFVIKAICGGLVVGGLGYISIKYLGGRYLFGVGYDGIENALSVAKPLQLDWSVGAEMTLTTLLLLVVLKILATSMTLAAGGSGGVFAPALFIGAMVGGAFGVVVNVLFPETTAAPGAYALVGMGAVFAGAAHAPMTSVLILFEMTDDYQIILPLMIAVVISYLVSSGLKADSIYTIKLRRRGGLTPPKSQTSALELILVADAMATDYQTIGPEEPVENLAARIYADHNRAFMVVDKSGKLLGLVAKYDVETALMAGEIGNFIANDIMTANLITCSPDQRLLEVLNKLTSQDVGRIPVVDKQDPQKLLGVLRREEIFWAYGEMAVEHQRLLQKSGLEMPGDNGDAVQVELEVDSSFSGLCFKKIREIQVPDLCVIALLRRAQGTHIPRGETVIEPGDVLVVLTTKDREEELRQWFSQKKQTE